MRRIFLTSLMLSFAFAATAQQAPMLVVGGESQPASAAAQNAVVQSFPEWAVTRAGANSSGANADIPPPPAAAENPSSAPTGTPPDMPAAPAAPKSPITQAWPFDSVPIFMKACVGYHPELVGPCSCTITHLVNAMPHDEFLQLSASGTIESDQRLIDIRNACATQPRQRD